MITTARQTVKNRAQGSNELIIKSLQEFYQRPANLAAVLPILNGTAPFSLRLTDWFVTNYSKKFNVIYQIPDGPEGKETRPFMVHFHYKRELKAYSKRLFDPFCRRERISFQVYGADPIPETTVGQLNFFRWAIENGVLDYITAHVTEIEANMNVSYKEHMASSVADEKTPTGRRKRKEMSHTNSKGANRFNVPVVVSFD